MKKWSIVVLIFCCIATAAAQDIRIACVGNSITQYKTPYPNFDPNCYPTQLGILLADGYDVHNFGVSGTTLLKNGDLPYWDQQALTDALNFEPDIVTIMLGTNDSKPQNWAFKEEFKADYIAMIDTFRSLPSNPVIYVCLPSPATSSKYSISGDTIANEIIPILNEVIQEKNTEMIDFHTYFTNKEYFFYDGIHPSEEGCWEFALYLYSILKSEGAPEVQTITEVNLALNKTILSVQPYENLDRIVDGSIHTIWHGNSGESITIDLGAVESVDMFQMIYQSFVHFGYTIEGSEDNATWQTLVDASDNPDTEIAAIEPVESVDTRYVRFTINSLDPDVDQVKLGEIKILQTAPIHAPVIVYEVARIASKYARLDFYIMPSVPDGYIKYSYDTQTEDNFVYGIGYQDIELRESSEIIQFDTPKYYIAKYYKDHYEVSSDTMKFEYSIISNVETKTDLLPGQWNLHQNYPNPFNPSTQIQFELGKPSNVKLTIYNSRGEKVRTVLNQFLKAGSHICPFNANNLPSGAYFYTLESDGQQIHKRMLLIK